MKRPSFFPASSPVRPAPTASTLPTAQYTQLALLPGDDITVGGLQGQFVKWREENGKRWLILQTTGPQQPGDNQDPLDSSLSIYRIKASPDLAVALHSDHLPSFSQLARCDWGTYVTVRGQAARFNQAGVIDGRNIVVVLAGSANPVLKALSVRCEPVGAGESAFYIEFHKTGLRMGTPAGAPMLRDQAATCLRRDDQVLVNGLPATFMCLRRDIDTHWLALRARPEQASLLEQAGAKPIGDFPAGTAWRLRWSANLRLRLLSARLPTFAQLRRTDTGTRVTLGATATPAVLHGTCVHDGTRQFVMVRISTPPAAAAPGINRLPSNSRWNHRIRFQEAGLRLVEDL